MKDPSTDLLPNLYIASPCDIPWSAMIGDDRQRVCNGCSRNVYNISDMTRIEAENFLRCNGISQCMIFFRRQDGTIMTDDCPVALRRIRDRCKLLLKFVAGFVAVSLSMFSARVQAQESDENLYDGGRTMPKNAPPGTHYQGNPAGGGFILVQDGTNTRVPPNVPVRPPAKTIFPNWQPNVTRPKVKLRVEKKQLLRTDANDFFQKGQAAAAKNQRTLAEFYYEKALDFYDSQPHGDPNFRKLIETRLNAVKTERR